MAFRWVILIAASIALLAPLPAFYSRKRRYRTLQNLEIERRNGSIWPMLKNVLRFSGHWVELARGLLASFAVRETIDDLQSVSQLYTAHAASARFVLPLFLAFICVVVTGILFRYPGKSIAPIAFVSATILVLVPITVAAPALVLAGFCSFGLRSLPVFFGILGPTLAVLGFMLDRQRLPSLAAAILAMTPLVLAFFRHHELVIPVRRSHS